MIQSDPNPRQQPSIIQPPQVAAYTPPVVDPLKGSTFVTPPTPPAHSSAKKSVIFLLVILFIAAVAGGLIAFQNFSKSGDSLTKEDATFAWRPYRIAATCAGVRVIGETEAVPYTFNLTFVLSQGERSGTFTHVFTSKPIQGGNKVDDDVTWSALGSDGGAFGSLLQSNDLVNWEVTVNYTLNGVNRTENYADSFRIYECAGGSTPNPSPSATIQASPSATIRPSSTASVVPTASATVRPTSSASASATVGATATAVPTNPPVGGPTTTPEPTATPTPTRTPSPTPTVAPTTTTQATNPPVNTEVAQAQSQAVQTEGLPKAGISYNSLFMILGTISLILSGVLIRTRRKFD